MPEQTDNPADTPAAAPLHRTALASRHEALGARMVPFAGWTMPIQYRGVLEEHEAVRSTCGLFDVGHMGVVFVSGDDAGAFLDALVTNDLGTLRVGRAKYTLCCDDTGGVIDDLIIARLGDDVFQVVPNASNVAAVVAILRDAAAAGGGDVTIDDRSEDWGILAVQGPSYRDVLDAVLPDVTVGRFDAVRFTAPSSGDDAAEGGVVWGTGYTGSPGVEIMAPWATIVALWDGMMPALEAVGGMPAGLGARDTLRLEMGYPLHGQDISPTISPLEANLGWAVKLDKGPFRGRDALVAQRDAGIPRTAVGLVAEGRRPLRAHCDVLDAAGDVIGEVTSGGFSPGLRRGVALALVQRGSVPATVDVRGSLVEVTPTAPPFVAL
jgi:aminomethyltransferase